MYYEYMHKTFVTFLLMQYWSLTRRKFVTTNVALFFNDLEAHLANSYGRLTYISSLMENCFENEDIVVYLKLFVLLHANDTIVLANYTVTICT